MTPEDFTPLVGGFVALGVVGGFGFFLYALFGFVSLIVRGALRLGVWVRDHHPFGSRRSAPAREAVARRDLAL